MPVFNGTLDGTLDGTGYGEYGSYYLFGNGHGVQPEYDYSAAYQLQPPTWDTEQFIGNDSRYFGFGNGDGGYTGIVSSTGRIVRVTPEECYVVARPE